MRQFNIVWGTATGGYCIPPAPLVVCFGIYATRTCGLDACSIEVDWLAGAITWKPDTNTDCNNISCIAVDINSAEDINTEWATCMCWNIVWE